MPGLDQRQLSGARHDPAQQSLAPDEAPVRGTAALAAKLALRGLVVTPAHRLASDVELQCRRDFYRHHIGEGYAGASG